MPVGTQSQRRGRRSGTRQDEQLAHDRRQPRRDEPDDVEDGVEDDVDDDDEQNEGDGMDLDENSQEDSLQQLTKNMVRYAISCEHSRISIRRDAIKDKVLGPNNARMFKQVFEQAQGELRNVFGMEMVELPIKDQTHLSAAERKKKVASQSQPKSTHIWILRTTLPPAFRVPAIMAPSKAPTQEQEAAYIGLYTWVIAVITISGGQISQSKLVRHLTRVNANVNTPVGKTADFLSRLQRQGYVDKIIDKNQGDDDKVSYVVGPRGKTEISKEALASHIREIYGPNPGPDFEKRLATSLGLPMLKANSAETEMGDDEE